MKPTKEGVYRTKLIGDSSTFYQYWNGQYWCESFLTPEKSAQEKHKKSYFQDVDFEEVHP